METGRIVRVGVPQPHGNERLSFQSDLACLELRGKNDRLGNLTREARFPKAFEIVWRNLPRHSLNDFGRRYGFSIRKAIEKYLETEEMVAVSMRNVNGSQLLATCGNPVGQLV